MSGATTGHSHTLHSWSNRFVQKSLEKINKQYVYELDYTVIGRSIRIWVGLNRFMGEYTYILYINVYCRNCDTLASYKTIILCNVRL